MSGNYIHYKTDGILEIGEVLEYGKRVKEIYYPEPLRAPEPVRVEPVRVPEVRVQ